MPFAFCIAACAAHRQPVVLPEFHGEPDLALVTWNVHGGEGDVVRLHADLRDGGLTGGRAPEHYVLLLQEAADMRMGGLHSYFAPARVAGAVERGNLILSTLPLMSARTIELPRGRQRRVAAVATLRLADADLLLVNVHLENRASWWRGGLPGDRIRARQMAALVAQLPPGPGILGGDLNIWLGTQEEAYRSAAARFPDAVSTAPAHTFRDRLALDHLFIDVPPGWTSWTVVARNRFGSDHHPVLAVLTARESVQPCHAEPSCAPGEVPRLNSIANN